MGTNDKNSRSKPLDEIKKAIEQKDLPEHEQEKLLDAHKETAGIAEKAVSAAAVGAAAASKAEASSPKVEEPVDIGTPPTPPTPHDHHGVAKGFWGAVIACAVIIGALFFFTSHYQRQGDEYVKESAAKTDASGSIRFYAVTSPAATGADAAMAVQTAKEMQAKGAAALKDGEKSPVVVYLFNYDNSGVKENKTLNDVAKRAKDTNATVAVVAYTDERGSDAYNQSLSQRRADAIAKYLVAHGVPANHIKAKGAGETHQFGSDQQCRRAVLTFN